MPPKKGKGKAAAKKGASAAARKQQQKVAQRVVEDKTFGLKNKNKSKKVQRFIREVQQGQGLVESKQEAAMRRQQREYEKRAAEDLKMMASLNQPVIRTRVPVGVDPKSRVCEFFKVGKCTKGDRCKFSHDLNVERKADKRSVHAAAQEEKEQDKMEDWDQDKLESVVNQKQGSVNRNLKTKIVCKHFLKAIEDSTYGWFWDCPNGGKACMYVHSLPPGFVLKTKKQEESSEDEVNFEQVLEDERHKLTTHTPLTLETFLEWKAKKAAEEDANQQAKKKSGDGAGAGKGGSGTKFMRSGREMFEFDHSLFVDDDMAEDTIEREVESDDDDVHEIEVTATSIARTRIQPAAGADAAAAPAGEDANSASATSEPGAAAGAEPSAPAGVAIDESLFDDEDLDDLPSDDDF